jgi:addiction module RelE/StbE family toxin
MIVEKIYYSKKFFKTLSKLPKDVFKNAVKKEKIFKNNPLHPSLRLHELHGNCKKLWSISVNKNYRIIFKRKKNGDIIFVSIGVHDIYKNL